MCYEHPILLAISPLIPLAGQMPTDLLKQAMLRGKGLRSFVRLNDSEGVVNHLPTQRRNFAEATRGGLRNAATQVRVVVCRTPNFLSASHDSCMCLSLER